MGLVSSKSFPHPAGQSLTAGYHTDWEDKTLYFIGRMPISPGFAFMSMCYYYRTLILHQENNSEVLLHAS